MPRLCSPGPRHTMGASTACAPCHSNPTPWPPPATAALYRSAISGDCACSGPCLCPHSYAMQACFVTQSSIWQL